MKKPIRKAFLYPLYPTPAQEKLLDKQLWACRSLYNAALTERREAYRMVGKSINYYDQANQLKEIRLFDLDLARVNFSACQDVLKRLDKAFKALFSRIAKGEKPGFPRYKGFGRYDSITWPSYGDGCKLKASGKVYIQNVGEIRFKQHRNIQGNIKTITIRKQGAKWFVCFSCQYEFDVPEYHNGPPVGIDVGLEHFANYSDGTQIDNPRFFRKAQKRLAKAQRHLAKFAKNDPKRRKARTIVGKAFRKVRNQRQDFAHKLSRSLVTNHSLVVVEDLNVKGLASGMLAKSVNDAGWSTFITMLEYKAENAGALVIKVNPRYTSQECPDCGAIAKKELSVRWHSCPCGCEMHRDIAAAIIILRRGLASLRNQPLEAVAL